MVSSNNNLVSIEWHFKSRPAIIWQAWTDPEMVKQWFGSDPNGKVLKVTLDTTIGGHFEVTFIDSDKTEHTCFGNYTDIKTHTLLKFTWSWKSEPGRISYITVILMPEKDGTLMNFEHTNIDPVSAHNYKIGWRNTFEKLERLLEN